ncbi:MAG TPA: hypothetical protein VF912_18765 [Anaeromyxobacter sp.]
MDPGHDARTGTLIARDGSSRSDRLDATDRWIGSTTAALAGGAAATAAITVLSAASRALGLMTLDFGRTLGTTVRPDRRSTRALGWIMHGANGVLFALGYRALFRAARVAPDAQSGVILGAAHFAAAIAGLAVAPYVHPRPRQAGLRPLRPTAYGPMTIPGMLVGHVVYGAIVGRALTVRRAQDT